MNKKVSLNEFQSEKIDKNRINDKNLIDRILKNSKENDFDYLDSVGILKNKNFVIIQLLIIFFIFSLISIILIYLGFIYAYIGIIISIMYVLFIYKKFIKIENKVLKEKEDLKLKELKEKINKKWYELFLIMEKIPIERERIEYTRKKFQLKIINCKTIKEYENVLEEITDDITKYKNVSGNYKNKNNPLTKELLEAFFELDLPPESTFEEVKKKYKELIKKHHPDTTKGSSDKIIRLNNSYNILKEYFE